MGKKRIRRIEKRIAKLEATAPDLPAAIVIKSRKVDTQTMWRNTSTDYAGYIDEGDDEGWTLTGYL